MWISPWLLMFTAVQYHSKTIIIIQPIDLAYLAHEPSWCLTTTFQPLYNMATKAWPPLSGPFHIEKKKTPDVRGYKKWKSYHDSPGDSPSRSIERLRGQSFDDRKGDFAHDTSTHTKPILSRRFLQIDRMLFEHQQFQCLKNCVYDYRVWDLTEVSDYLCVW